MSDLAVAQQPREAVDDATTLTNTDDEKAPKNRSSQEAEAAGPAGHVPVGVQPPRSTVQIALLMTAACVRCS